MRPLTLLTEDMLKRVNTAAVDVQGKADEESVRRELAKLNSVQDDQQVLAASVPHPNPHPLLPCP